jgi:hypothetical protein
VCPVDAHSERALVLAPHGRDAVVAVSILSEVGLDALICRDLTMLLKEMVLGTGVVVLTDETIRSADVKGLAAWVRSQPAWSDLPFVLLTERGGAWSEIPLRRGKWKLWATSSFWKDHFIPRH